MVGLSLVFMGTGVAGLAAWLVSLGTREVDPLQQARGRGAAVAGVGLLVVGLVILLLGFAT